MIKAKCYRLNDKWLGVHRWDNDNHYTTAIILMPKTAKKMLKLWEDLYLGKPIEREDFCCLRVGRKYKLVRFT